MCGIFILFMYKNFKKNSYNRFSNHSRNRFPQKRRFSGGKQFSQKINISKFINKAVVTEKTESFVPVNQFSDFNFNPGLMANIVSKGYAEPTPIQDKIISHILQGSDVMGAANTGTGKTGAFLIPLIQKVLKNPKEKVIIVVPTRELAEQINREFKSLAKGLRIYSVCCVGGASIRAQIFDLKQYNNFIIGTPGRLKDLIQRKLINLFSFSTIVLDEADRMLDMGFIVDIKFIMSLMPKNRHTLLFSATMVREVETLAREFLNNPVTISVKTGDTPENIEQDIVKVGGAEKIAVLQELLFKVEFTKVLIFGKTKHGVENLSKKLVARGFKAESIHGNKSHPQRQRSLESFRINRIQILVATDVAARGLDIPDVSHVINYDMPNTHEDYIHRIGRTGRSNKKGMALTFID